MYVGGESTEVYVKVIRVICLLNLKSSGQVQVLAPYCHANKPSGYAKRAEFLN